MKVDMAMNIAPVG